MFFVGQVSSGPFVEFKTFDEFISYRGNYATIGSFDTWYSAFKRYLHGWASLVVAIGITQFITPEYTITEEFVNDQRGVMFKVGYNMLTM
jgi:hypothetical protein